MPKSSLKRVIYFLLTLHLQLAIGNKILCACKIFLCLFFIEINCLFLLLYSITGALRLPTMRRSLMTYRCGCRTGHHRTGAISTDPASATPQPSPRPFPGQVPPQSWPCQSPAAIQPAVHKTDQGTESEPSESAPFNKCKLVSYSKTNCSRKRWTKWTHIFIFLRVAFRGELPQKRE